LLKPEDVMKESVSRHLDGMKVLAIQKPEIEGHHCGQDYQDNSEHYPL